MNPVACSDGNEREMAKWSHSRLVRAQQRAEDEQRLALVELDLGLVEDDDTPMLTKYRR
jgi:hypothetical protein